MEMRGANTEFVFDFDPANAENNSQIDFKTDGSRRLLVKSTGIDVTGEVVADGLTVNVNNDIKISRNGTSSQKLFWDRSGVVDGSLELGADENLTLSVADDGRAGQYIYFNNNTKRVMSLADGGDVSFYEDTGTTAKLFWDASAESLGVGTTNPLTSLWLQDSNTQKATFANGDFVANSAGSTFDISMGATTGSTYTSLRALTTGRNAWGNLVLQEGGGNVGIGTSPSYALDVSKGSSGVVARFTGGGAASYIYADSTTVYYGAAAGVPNTLAINNASNFMNFNTNGEERARIDSSGNVGIGDSSPSVKLDVYQSTAGIGAVDFRHVNGNRILINPSYNYHDAYNHVFRGLNGTDTHMTIDNSGNLSVLGSLSKGSGSFKINHPLPEKTETHHLVHSFVEAPQADNIYRGKVALIDGVATVNIDTVAGMTEGTYVLLNTNTQCFTSNESGWTAVKGSVSGNILTITSQESCSDTISWMVVGERHDQHMLDTEWTDETGKVIVEPSK
jgi:hypothetical protein